MYLFKESDYFVMFCADPKCMSECAKTTKDTDNIEREKAPERRNGRILTGAMKFNLGAVYDHASLAQWVGCKAYQDTILDWFKNNRPFLVVLGNPGTGKTYMSAAILNYFFERKEDVFYLTHRSFITDLREAIEKEIPQRTLFERYCEKKILILDDLGSGHNTDWQQEMILELIDRRYSNMQKTLITSNFDRATINEVMGNRTASRLFDKSNMFIEIVGTIDRRIEPEEAW